MTYNPARAVGPQHPDHDVHVATRVFPIMDARGQFEALVVMHEDVTARVKAEEALRESHANLERRVEERTAQLENEIERGNALRRQLEGKNRELEDFAFRVGHDLKNSLLSIRTLVDLARSEPQVHVDNMDAIVQGSNHLIDFVERLLQMARAGRVIARKEPASPEALARRVFERLSPLDPDATLHVHEPIRPVLADPMSLEQILGNVISNAFQHRDATRPLRIDLSTRPVGERVEICVHDNGTGIAPENLERVFAVCFSTCAQQNKGFGLVIVEKLVAAHGGTVRAESPGPGQGASFIFDLPAAGSAP